MGKILIVDDDKITVNAFMRQLKKRGYETVFKTSGADAIDYIKCENPDMVLLDHMMPDMDGLDTYREIREIAPHIPVIMITGHGSLPLSVEFMKLGGRDFMEKPFDFDILDIKIEQVFKSVALEEKMREMAIEKKTQIEIEKIRNTIIAFISHDLLAPLEEMKKTIDETVMITSGYRGDIRPFIEKLDTIERISCELNFIVNDLLETALIRKGVDLLVEPVDLSQLIREIEADLKTNSELPEPHTHIRWNINDPLPLVRADRQKLKKVILNLVKNAFATRKATVTVIDAWSEEEGVVLSICSNNMVFFKSLTEMVSEPKEKDQGYSSFRFWIGFSLAHKLAELMGCQLRLEKYLSQGSLVYLLIPSMEAK